VHVCGAARVDRNKTSVFGISSTLSGLYWAGYMQFGSDSSVFIAAVYQLDGPGEESR
jgi:hypothetical protein